MIRRLLERDAHDAPAVAEFAGAIASQLTGEILDRHLPLQGHATAARREGAHAQRHRPTVAAALACLGTAGSFWTLRPAHPDTRHSTEPLTSTITPTPF